MVLNKKNVSKFDENFIKNYDEDSNNGYIFEVDIEYSKQLLNCRSDSPFLSDRMKIKNEISLFVIHMTKKTMLFM